jgi:type II secretion system protein H
MQIEKPKIRYSTRRAFTLIELILVMALLTILTSLVTPSISRFLAGRALDSEARQLLSLTHAARSRAAADGFPMLLWVDSPRRAYGLQEEGKIQNGNVQDVDPKAEEFSVGDNVQVEAVNASPVQVNGQSLPAIRFLPEGVVDENSPPALRLTSRDGETLWLIQPTNGLNYEIRNSDQ